MDRTVTVGWVRRTVVVVPLVLALAGFFAPPSLASEDPAEAGRSGEAREARPSSALSKVVSPKPAQNTQDHSMAFWTWPQRGWGYFLTDGAARSQGGFATVTRFDLDSGEELGRRALDRLGYMGSNASGFEGPAASVAVDPDGGRLFVAYSNALAVAGRDLNGQAWASTRAERGEVCASTSETVGGIIKGPCVAGVSVLDATTLEARRHISLTPVRVDGGALSPHLLAMSWSPPRGPEDAGKLHLVVAEYTHESPAGGNEGFFSPRRSFGTVVTYLVQMDPETGVQEWAVRLDACRGGREMAYYPYSEGHTAAVFRGRDLADPAVFVACVANTAVTGAVVRVPLDASGAPAGLPVRTGDPQAAAEKAAAGGARELSAGEVAGPSRGQSVVFGPDRAKSFLADPGGGRMLVRVAEGEQSAITEVWWVFDTSTMRWTGTIGIGSTGSAGSSQFGVDPATGRLYSLTAKGLALADTRRNPLPQALVYPEFAPLKHTSTDGGGAVDIVVVPAVGEGGLPRVFTRQTATRYRNHNGTQPMGWLVIEDPVAVSVDAVVEPFEGRTQDLDEVAGVTASALDGAARGFGARAILISGVDAVSRVGPVDPIGRAQGETEGGDPPSAGYNTLGIVSPGVRDDVARAVRPPCTGGDRDLVVAFTGSQGPAVVDGAGGRGSAEPVVFDTRSRADFEAAVSRCSQQDWSALWTAMLFGAPPVAEPTVPWVFAERGAECVSAGDEVTDSVGDSVSGAFASSVSCAEGEASGHSYARGVELAGLSVGEALSSFRIYRDPARGVVSRVESVARGVHLPGVLRISTVRGVAESWANGRRQPAADAERDAGYDPNCDFERTAGTCLQRHLVGFWSPGYSCGPCGDEGALVEGLNRVSPTTLTVRFRTPDEVLARGAGNGFTAAVQKPDQERFADLVLNNDLLQTVVPTLEIIRYAPSARGQAQGPRGRQVIQLAGVEVSSSYSIQCVLVYDEAANTCGLPAEAPGSIQVSLSDPDGKALAGGAFEVRQDVDADGVLGLKDTLLPDGACVTTDDGVGTCTFENLQPGTYLVSQVAAPPGYAKSSGPWVSEVASGEQRTVAFTNVSDVSTIDLMVTDENGAPISGAVFAAYPDPDADGKVAPDAQPAAECTTDSAGVCSMKVPAGSYVLVQMSAPGGLEGIEPVAFTFASGGQVASVSVVNYPPDAPTPPEGTASPEIAYTAPVGYSPPIESIDGTYVPADSVDEPATAGPSVPEQIGGTVVRVIRAPGDALRLLARDPQQAVAWTAALALLCLAGMAVRRRSILSTLTLAPAGLVAFAPPPRSPRPGPVAQNSGSVVPAAGLRDRPPPAGASLSSMAATHVDVVLAITSPVLATLAVGRLAVDGRINVVATADSLAALRDALDAQSPDVVVVDLTLPTMAAYDVTEVLHGLHAPERTIGLIPPERSAEALITRGHRAGMGGLLVVDDDMDIGSLAYAVRCVAAGKLYFGPAVQSVLIGRWGDRVRRRGRKAARGLTARELEIAHLAATGLSRAEIARQLTLSPDTVKRHLYTVRAKLGVVNPWDSGELRLRLAQQDLTGNHDPD